MDKRSENSGATAWDFLFRPIATLPLLAVSIAASILLFAPDKIVLRLRLLDFRDKYRICIGPIFLLSASYLLALCVLAMFKRGSRRAERSRYIKRLRIRLDGSTEEEKAILYQFVRQDQRAMPLVTIWL